MLRTVATTPTQRLPSSVRYCPGSSVVHTTRCTVSSNGATSTGTSSDEHLGAVLRLLLQPAERRRDREEHDRPADPDAPQRLVEGPTGHQAAAGPRTRAQVGRGGGSGHAPECRGRGRVPGRGAHAASPAPVDGDRARACVAVRQAVTSDRSTYCRIPPLR